MPVLQDQDTAYVGEEPVVKIMLGGLEVWAPPPDTVAFTFGDTGSNGGGNWPTAANRALLRQVTLAQASTFTQFNMRLRPESGSGDRFKGLIYAADGVDSEPGTLLLVSDPTGVGSPGALLTASCPTILIPGGLVWIGYVSDGGSGGSGYTDSGGTTANATIMLNSGETNYASPSNPAGDWPGSPGPYSNNPALWFDGYYQP